MLTFALRIYPIRWNLACLRSSVPSRPRRHATARARADPGRKFTEDLTRTGADQLALHRCVPDGRTLYLGEIHRDGPRFTVTANSPARLDMLDDILRAAAPAAVEVDRHDDIECIMLEAKRDGRPTDGLMDADRLRSALHLGAS
jgi:hypothetical protein